MYDYLFIGYGASTCLTLRALLRNGKLTGKSVAIIDPDFQKGNDKTFCFWSEEHDSILEHNRDLIDKSWRKIRVDEWDVEALSPLSYHHIESQRLYDTTRAMLEHSTVDWFEASVDDLQPLKRGVRIQAGTIEVEAKKIFDSRPAGFERSDRKPFVWQSFLGYRVRVNNPVFDAEVYHKMDFQIPQDGATQFVYVLPFSETEALVEWTRFGVDRVDHESAREGLDQYIQDRFGAYEIVREEIGAIPMATGSAKVEDLPHVESIGTRAGKVKPSTGYAFKRMYDHAEELISDAIKSKSAERFAWYDHLLLWILVHQPQWGRTIFKTLFKTQSAVFVLRFLDEQSKLYQEIPMFLRLPLRPFIHSAMVYIGQWMRDRWEVFFTPILAALLVALAQWNSALALQIGIPLLVFGFLLVGLPHGALDAYLERGKQSLPRFIGRYLSLMAAMLFLWWLAPLLALILFVACSALHFGQTDTEEWGLKNAGFAFPWGVSLLSILLISHWSETAEILSEWGIYLSASTARWESPTLLFLFAGSTALALYHRKEAWLASLATLALGTQLPLLVAFGLYFVGQHSLNGWKHLQRSQGWSHTGMYLRGLPYTLGAVLFFAIVWWMDASLLTAQWSWLFVALSVVSFPHVVEMHRFYERRT